jgi:hypothetical protein
MGVLALRDELLKTGRTYLIATVRLRGQVPGCCNIARDPVLLANVDAARRLRSALLL